MSAIKTQETSAVPAWVAGTADVSWPPPPLAAHAAQAAPAALAAPAASYNPLINRS